MQAIAIFNNIDLHRNVKLVSLSGFLVWSMNTPPTCPFNRSGDNKKLDT
jgi:hypothetical protein